MKKGKPTSIVKVEGHGKAVDFTVDPQGPIALVSLDVLKRLSSALENARLEEIKEQIIRRIHDTDKMQKLQRVMYNELDFMQTVEHIDHTNMEDIEHELSRN